MKLPEDMNALPVGARFSVKLLDSFDVTNDYLHERGVVREKIPGLIRELDQAGEWVAGSLAPVPPGSPADDTWDDQIYFMRAMNESDYTGKKKRLEIARSYLEKLLVAADPVDHIASSVIAEAHKEIRRAGGNGKEARARSKVTACCGVPIAEIIWQARNQHEHYEEDGDLSDPVRTLFAKLANCHYSVFNFQFQPGFSKGDDELKRLCKRRSWSPVILGILGWTSSENATRGIVDLASSISR